MHGQKQIHSEGNRIESLDAIRGFSLFGILVVNILSFHAPYFFYGGEGNYSDVDRVLLSIIDIFFQASFYPLFSLLFGIGIYIMYEKQLQRSNQPYKILMRRMIILAIIGIFHGIFLWYGDILLSYALFGAVSLLFIRKSVRSLLIWSMSLLLIPTILITLSFYSIKDELHSFENNLAISQSIASFKDTYSEIFTQNLTNWLISYDLYQWIMMTFIILPMFLIGMVIWKKGWITNYHENLKEIKKWFIISFIIFIIFKIGPYFFDKPIWMDFAQDVIGGSFSSIFYFILLLILFKGRYLQLVRRILSHMGKLSLTNYMAQSVICFFLFYGVGFNLYDELSISTLMIIVVIIYFGQLIVSRSYVKKFNFGPLEWIYRSLTYKTLQPIKRRD